MRRLQSKKTWLLCFILSSAIYACQPAPILEQCENSDYEILKNSQFNLTGKAAKYQNAIFIINEGSYTYGNASISSYNPNSNLVENNVFSKVNYYALGDVAQSIYRKDDSIYIVVNNSQKIEIVATNTFERIKTIKGFSSPRYIHIDQNNIVSTDLYENKIVRVNSVTGCEISFLNTLGWTEEIIIIGDKFWIVERNSIGEDKFANLLIVNKDSLKIDSRIPITVEPNSVLLDDENNLWVLSSGDENKNAYPTLQKINTISKTVENTFAFDSFTKVPLNLCFNDDKLYYNIGQKVYSMKTNDSQLPSSEVFSSNAQIIYNISIEPMSAEIYICDALDYASSGKVYRYSSSFAELDVFEVGVIPSKILFD